MFSFFCIFFDKIKTICYDSNSIKTKKIKWEVGSEILIAFVLVHTEGGGTEKEVVQKLRKMKEVQEAYIVTDPYDIIVKLIVQDKDELTMIVRHRIRKIERVLSTATHVVTKEFYKNKEGQFPKLMPFF